jgi:hypothetical protein
VILLVALRVAGATLLGLALLHAFFWRTFDWGRQIERLPPMTARVFVVHTGFIVFVLAALGLLSLGWPHLLVAPSDLARLLLYAVVLFWIARLVLQPLVFDPTMTDGWASSPAVRSGASLAWAAYVAVYGAALLRQLGWADAVSSWIAPFDLHAPVAWLRLGVAGVWLLFGLVFKALGALPRHRRIVARVVGDRAAGSVTSLVAFAEIGMCVWMLAGRFLPACAAAQTLLVVAMNTLELRHARDLLVAPIAMVCANAVFLSLGWYVALAS